MNSDPFPPNPGVSSSPSRRQRQGPPTSLNIPSLLAFQQKNQGSSGASPVRRKPLPPNASHLTPKPTPSNNGTLTDSDKANVKSPPSSSVTAPAPAAARVAFLPPVQESPTLDVRDLDKFPRGLSPLLQGQGARNASAKVETKLQQAVPEAINGPSTSRVTHSRLFSDSVIEESPPKAHKQTRSDIQRSVTMALHPSKKPPPLRVLPAQRSLSTTDIHDSPATIKQPRTPGSKLTSFFSWKNSSPGGDSSSTEISDNGHSPLPSPLVPSPQTSAYSSRSIPRAIDTSKASASTNAAQFGGFLPHTMAVEPDLSTKVGQLEGELREISSELACSIRREMELEDMVERLQLEAGQGHNFDDRTSDYFSDSGTSSVRCPLNEMGSKSDDIEKVKRRSEQERAQLKVDLSQRWQEEISRRKALESHVQLLEEQVQQFRRDKTETSNIAARAKQLESSLEDTRRRLAEERQLKDNFEDLLTAMRGEIEQHRNERDNLRDEIVPQLKAQVDGLEANASESQKLTYDYARMQQEIQALRNENATLTHARKLQLEMQQQQMRFNSIAEEGDRSSQSPVGLMRSNSVARTPRIGTGLARSGSLSRSNSITGKGQESRESLADRMKDVEMQRDALHRAVKSLLDRQAYQTRENEKRIRMLELERDRAMQSGSPRRRGYEKEVKNLREEINLLRRRADEALEQKWQCEKGLGGLKMDLDRAEQETSSLRSLLQEHNVSVPEHLKKSQEALLSVQETSSSLQSAYQQLQADRQQIESRKDSFRSLEEEQKLADQLRASSRRTEDLAAQVRHQLDTNNSLRNRLAEAVGRGEREQKASVGRINDLQGKLKTLEDTVVVAQQHSEEAVTQHEDEIRTLKDSHNAQLHRVKSGLRTPTMFSPRSPLSPMFAAKSPRLDKTTSGLAMPLNQALKTEYLEKKVKELEKALADADQEMEEVVGRMNMAQIEVAELQADRDEALRQTRRLQAEILAEREKVKALMG